MSNFKDGRIVNSTVRKKIIYLGIGVNFRLITNLFLVRPLKQLNNVYIYNYRQIATEQRIQTLSIHTKSEIKHVELNIEGEIEMEVNGSDIKLTYATNVDHSQPNTANLETLKNILIEKVRLIINVFGYTDSFYLDVYLLNVKCEELNINWDFGIKGEYNINRNENDKKAEFNKIMSLFKGEDYSPYSWLKDIFTDFHNAIKYPVQTAQYCFRAIETIRQNYYEDRSNTDDGTRRDSGWDRYAQN